MHDHVSKELTYASLVNFKYFDGFILTYVTIYQVTKREVNNGWKNWKWRSSMDRFMNGAYFVQSGYGSCAPNYSRAQSFTVLDGSMVPAITSDAGPLLCNVYKAC